MNHTAGETPTPKQTIYFPLLQPNMFNLVRLPKAPKTASPVPHLTSIHSSPARGPFGDPKYPGNCGGAIIKDLLMYFKPKGVLDPMSGSGTCKDVCDELKIACDSFDLRKGFDAADTALYPPEARYDFVWLHPPYWRMKAYSDHPRCLSNAPDLDTFYRRLRLVVRNCRSVLSEHGKLAVLMGDYFDRRLGKMVPCVHLAKDACLNEGLWPACTDIVRFQHGNSSSKKAYPTAFIPGLHDTCMVFERAR